MPHARLSTFGSFWRGMAGWNSRHGSWWAIHWQVDGWASLGLHVDLKRRITAEGERYGPYVDLHLGPVIASVGVNPIRSTSYHACMMGRAGESE